MGDQPHPEAVPAADLGVAGARALRGAGQHAGRPVLRLFGGPRADTRQFVSREELKALLQLEPGEASVSTQEAEMIDKIFDLGDTTVREVMVPLVDVVDAAGHRQRRATPSRSIQQRGFSRFPIYAARETNVIGVVTAMDLLSRGGQAAR